MDFIVSRVKEFAGVHKVVPLWHAAMYSGVHSCMAMFVVQCPYCETPLSITMPSGQIVPIEDCDCEMDEESDYADEPDDYYANYIVPDYFDYAYGEYY